jgi:hypothetical protein
LIRPFEAATSWGMRRVYLELLRMDDSQGKPTPDPAKQKPRRNIGRVVDSQIDAGGCHHDGQCDGGRLPSSRRSTASKARSGRTAGIL